MNCRLFWLLSNLIVFCLVRSTISSAQVVPDNTTNTRINGDCSVSCTIEGGIEAGNNLFQSFQEFNIAPNGKILFVDSGVTNIFSRITGGNVSQIFGTLGVSGGSANLFLINPNGIIFGENARLDLQGSFVATTANALRFGDLGDFSGNPSADENLALLTVDPSAFLFQQPQTDGNLGGINVDRGAILNVAPQQNLALSGDSVQITGGLLTAPYGNITLGAVDGEGTIVNNGLGNLDVAENTPKGNITLDEGAIVDVSGVGGGNIYLQGSEIILDRDSQLLSNTLGDLDGGIISIEAKNLLIQDGSYLATAILGNGKGSDISINTTESTTVIGRTNIVSQLLLRRGLSGTLTPDIRGTGIFSVTSGGGNTGNIEIVSQNLILNNEALITTLTFGDASTGNIEIDTTELVDIRSSGLSSISLIGTNGSVGDVNITTQRLLVRDGGRVLATTLGSGNGGNINIFASDSIELTDTPPTAFLPNGLYSGSILGTGVGGNIYLTTDRLSIKNGSTIAAASGVFIRDGLIPFGGSSGDILIRANDIELSGASIDNVFPSRIISDTIGQGDAGNLTIETGSLQLIGDAYISAVSLNGGNSGNLSVYAKDFVRVSGLGLEFLQVFTNQVLTGQLVDITQGRGVLFTVTATGGDAGDLNIVTPYLLLENGAVLITSSFGSGDSGSISIQADRIDVIESVINSGANGTGEGADLTIDTGTLRIINSSNVATASSNLGNAGDVRIRATDSIEILNEPNYRPIVSDVKFLPGIFTNSIGGADAGDLEIDTKNLILRNSGTIASQSLPNPFTFNPNVGAGGDLIIRAQSIEITGKSFNGLDRSGLFTSTFTNGAAGDLQVTTDILKIGDGGVISVNSTALGASGNLTIDAGTIQLDNGNITASTISGVGGNIDIQARDNFWLRNDSIINANAQNIGSGGNINLISPTVLILDNSQINASAIDGNGGKITIFTQGLFRSTESMLEASSLLGIDGIVSIDTPEIDPNAGLVGLSEQTTQSENTIAQTCYDNDGQLANSFVITGKGGFLEQPQQIRSTAALLEDLGISIDFNDNQGESENSTRSIEPDNSELELGRTSFIEAKGWYADDLGRVILTANINNTNNFADDRDRDISCGIGRDL
jgi:filamentous hemagglutinin family protein